MTKTLINTIAAIGTGLTVAGSELPRAQATDLGGGTGKSICEMTVDQLAFAKGYRKKKDLTPRLRQLLADDQRARCVGAPYASVDHDDAPGLVQYQRRLHLEIDAGAGYVTAGEHKVRIGTFGARLKLDAGSGVGLFAGVRHTGQFGDSNSIDTVTPIDGYPAYEGRCKHDMTYRNTGAELGVTLGQGARVSLNAGVSVSNLHIGENADCITALKSTGETYPTTAVTYDLGREGLAVGAFVEPQLNLTPDFAIRGRVAAPNLFTGPTETNTPGILNDNRAVEFTLGGALRF